MNILEKIREHAYLTPERTVMICGSRRLTWQQLWTWSDRLAAWIAAVEQDKAPVAVYGHKNPWMLVCFLACVKSGRAYCPIDISVPDERVKMIMEALPSGIVLATETLQFAADQETACGKRIIGCRDLEEIFQRTDLEAPGADQWVKGDETYYIIFTSGSTGTPKGVQITADCLGHYLDWSVGLGTSPEQKAGQVFLNQAPFSFDLSVMDLYTCLACGGTLFCLEKQVQSDYGRLLESLEVSEANVWVSTPSFADVCLSDPKFDQKLLPGLQVFLFCGETLGNRTARKLQERFPGAVVVNTYGPTESTVAVTDVLVTPELAAADHALPVGRAKPGTRIEIHDTDGKSVPEGEKGEIIIIGDTVSTGYYRQEELTKKAFFTVGESRAYHTGDEGYLRDGMLYYCGRIDLQIKLHGYRIELEDIENNIRRLPQISHAVVIPNQRGGKVSSLTAYVVLNEHARKLQEDCGIGLQTAESAVVQEKQFSSPGTGDLQSGAVSEKQSGGGYIPEDEKVMSARLKECLAAFLPSYMIPKKFVFLNQMPMTNNGKADRKLLGGKKA